MTILKLIKVGRGPENDIDINDEYMSTFHCTLTQLDNGTVWIEDQGSTNGTWVNGFRQYGSYQLFPGDTVKIGRTIIPWSS